MEASVFCIQIRSLVKEVAGGRGVEVYVDIQSKGQDDELLH